MNAVTDIVEVYDLLYRLGFSATNTAFFHLSYAVYLAALNPHWLVKPSQRLYPEVADQYNANPLQVVRSIDGFACASWHKNAVLLRSLTYRPLTAAPRPPNSCGSSCTISGGDREQHLTAKIPADSRDCNFAFFSKHGSFPAVTVYHK